MAGTEEAVIGPPVTGTRADSDLLVEQHLGLARSLARRFVNRGEPQEDLEQVAFLALIRVARRFDPDRHVSFVSFATVSILGELKHYFRDQSWWVRVPRPVHDAYLRLRDARESLLQQLGRSPTVRDFSDYLNMSAEAVLEAMAAGGNYRPLSLDRPSAVDGQAPMDGLAGGQDPYDALVDRQRLAELLPALAEQELAALRHYYVDDWSQREISRELGVSQMQVSRLISGSLRRLRGHL